MRDLKEALEAGSASTDELVLDRLFAAAPAGLGFIDRDHRYVRVNDALAAINGIPAADHIGRTPAEILGVMGAPVAALLDQVLRTGEPLSGLELVMPDGRHLTGAYVPVATADGEILGVLGVVQDISERRRVELDLERALEHSTQLQQVAASLSAALTVDEVAGVIVRASMDAAGATCGVLALRTQPGLLEIAHRFGMAGRAPSEIPLAAELPMPEAVRTRKPVLLGSRAEWLLRYPASPPRADFEAFVSIPLLFEGRASGCMGLGLPEERTPDEREVGLLSAIARQGAQALERARLYEERAYVAATLQEGLLPKRLPAIAGLEAAVAYRPVGDGSEVGGDFFDLVDLGGGGFLAAVGDVCGKGAKAAMLSGLVRTTIAAVAERGDRPVDILTLANRAIVRHSGERADYATAVCAVLSADGDGFEAVLGSAGHPPAIVLRANGALHTIDAAGVMLGVQADAEVQERTAVLAPGDALILYTDGVTDARNGREHFGDARLHAAITAAAGGSAQAIVDGVMGAMRGFESGAPRDDAAVLALRAAP
jgi:PAS domain S-box-containing protein